MPTLTMQSIADLTQVRREVVSVWRTRSAGMEHPFPSSLSADELLFDAGQVGEWLERTGRGNNPDAPLEVLLHSSQFDELLEDLEATSVLLLVHDLVGGPLAALTAEEALAATAPLDLGALVPQDRLAALLERSELVRTIDELAEVAFSGRGLLGRLLSAFTRPNGPWAGEALTPAGTTVLVDVVRGLLEQAPFRLDPEGRGGLLLAEALAAGLDDEAQPTFGLGDSDLNDPAARAALRMLAAHAGPDAIGERSPDVTVPHLALLQHQQVEDPHTYFAQVESVLLDLGPQDAAVVIGPSELLVEALADEPTRAARRRLLLPAPEAPAPLRFAARLPKGLSRFGGHAAPRDVGVRDRAAPCRHGVDRLRRARGHHTGSVLPQRDRGRRLRRTHRWQRIDRSCVPAQHPPGHERPAASTRLRAHSLRSPRAQRRREPGPAVGARRRPAR